MSQEDPIIAHHFVLSVRHRVAEPKVTAAWLISKLDFQLGEAGAGEVAVDNGALNLLLLPAGAEYGPGESLELEVICRDLEASAQRLISEEGVRCLGAARQVSPSRYEQRLTTPFGLDLVLVRIFDEDELGIAVPLDKSLLWQVEAETLIQETLRCVPVSFRSTARIKTTDRAEYLAGRKGSIEVDSDDAIRAVIETTPDFKHPDLRRVLQSQGVDLVPFSKYFSTS